MQAVWIYYITSLQLVLYNTFSEETLKYLFGMILNFFCTCLVIFLVWYLPKHKVLHNVTPQLIHLFLSFLSLANYIFLMVSTSFLHLVEHEPFSDFWVHSVESKLDPSLAVLSVLLMLRIQIHSPTITLIFYPCCISHFANRDRYEVLGGIVLALLILACGIFLKNMQLLVQPSVTKLI